MRSLLVALASVAACNSEPAKPAPHPLPPAQAQVPPATFGRPIHADTPLTSLADVTKTPASYKGKTIATRGTVTRVCQERGCWMAIQDSASSAVVRMHGHSFFVPTTSSGKQARVEGTVLLMKDGRECDDMTAENADIEIDAVGIELRDSS
jgi:hypothetical protein